MANTYTQIHIQVVFTVRNRECIISSLWKNDLFKYITGIIQNNQHKVLAINGMPDHVHILFGMRPIQSLSDLMQDVKGNSSKWINQNHFIKEHFSWQEGYGAFSYSKSQISNVIHYINNQEEHHKKMLFLDEYIRMLKESEILYDERFLFMPVEYDID
jgi:REP element-mobilizing transposase RayT